MTSPDPAFVAPGVAARDLSDAECAELDELLHETPEPFEPMGVVMLDGYLCGVLVQPVLTAPETWLPYVFDTDGRALPEAALGPWHARVVALTLRRYQALNRALLEDGAFEPLIEDIDEIDAEAAPEPGSDETAPEPEATPEALALSQSLVEWVAGFHFAAGVFTALEDLDDDTVDLALARIYRHLPAGDDEGQQEIREALEADLPLATLDDAVDDLVAAVADIADVTRELRFQVDTVRRETPKVGRNEPCPCGSGKKYKRCHGAADA